VLTREKPLTLRAVIAEQALRSTAEDEHLMYEQLGRLLSMGKRPNVVIQVLRSDARLHVGQLGTFSILGFGAHIDLDVAYTEGLALGALHRRPGPDRHAPDRVATTHLRR
jgi:hypothetical protein